jgi:hypothetical protein
VRRLLGVVAVGVALFAVLNVALLLIGLTSAGPSGPSSSSYAVGPSGLAAYAALLRRAGHPIHHLRTPLGIAPPPSAATVVLLDGGNLQPDDAAALVPFVDGGGRLIVGGTRTGPWVQSLFADGPQLTDTGPLVCRPTVAAPETVGVNEVESDAKGGWSDAGATLPILGCGGEILATVASPGAGRVVFLADAALLQNRLLSVRDNAAFGIDIAGPADRPVDFVEYVHGFKDARGLAALPSRWKVALVGLVIAAGLAMVARGSRPGPPPVERGEPVPSRRRHLEAVARLFAGAGNAQSRADVLRGRARRAVISRAGLAPDAPDGDVAEAARWLGLPADEVAATMTEGAATEDLARLGRVLARLGGSGTGQ